MASKDAIGSLRSREESGWVELIRIGTIPAFFSCLTLTQAIANSGGHRQQLFEQYICQRSVVCGKSDRHSFLLWFSLCLAFSSSYHADPPTPATQQRYLPRPRGNLAAPITLTSSPPHSVVQSTFRPHTSQTQTRLLSHLTI